MARPNPNARGKHEGDGDWPTGSPTSLFANVVHGHSGLPLDSAGPPHRPIGGLEPAVALLPAAAAAARSERDRYRVRQRFLEIQ